MSQTVDQITQGWMRLLTVKASGEALDADESVDGLQAFNELIEQINLQSLFQVAKTQITQAITANTGTYTFGTAGDNSVRPMEIFSAYVVKDNVSYPVRILMNEEYSDISFKTTTASYPYNIYYRNAYPLATLKMYPVPTAGSTVLYLETRAALSTYTAGTDTVDLAPGYIKYLKYQLAVDNGPEYKEASQSVRETAREAKELIKRQNSKDKLIMANTAQRATMSRRY